MRGLHALLLIIILPATLFWLPLVTSRLGNLTLSDVVLLGIWATTLLQGRATNRPLERVAWWIAGCALAPAFFLVVGTWTYDPETVGLRDVMQHLKRFGLASILPLALLRSHCAWLESFLARLCPALLLASLFIGGSSLNKLLFTYKVHRVSTSDFGGREIGVITNPNDFGYICLIVVAMILAHWSRGRKKRWAFWLTGYAFAGSCVCLAGLAFSASRSATAAFLTGALYVLVASVKVSAARRLAIALAVCLALGGAWYMAEGFQQRMRPLLEKHTEEINTAARIQAQGMAVRAWLDHPLGVGFVNLGRATRLNRQSLVTEVAGSDSIYVDFLLASGVFGLLSILSTLALSWSLIGRHRHRAGTEYHKAGLVAAATFGLGSISPASVFVAPFLFTLIGVAAARHAQEVPEARSLGKLYAYPPRGWAEHSF